MRAYRVLFVALLALTASRTLAQAPGAEKVVVTTRVWTGRVLPHYGFKGGGKTLQDAGAITGDDLSPQKARILLMLALQTTASSKQLQAMFDR